MKLNQIRRLHLDGEIPVNCYVIINGKQCFIVDPGYQKEYLRSYINREGLDVIGILLTHAHIDHIEALDCFQVPVYLHELEYELLANDAINGFKSFGKQKNYDLKALDVRTIASNADLQLGEEKISVIHTPGHTQGSVCYLCQNNLIVGDTLFEGSVGRWDRPTANMEQLQNSVLKLIDNQPKNRSVHPGHGPSTTIGKEKQNNPFYKEWKFKTENIIN